ncbi:MAG: ABC transporter permease [Bacteroidia bacterium]|nr:ABC transporter permease [Bacteroidia bacterium]
MKLIKNIRLSWKALLLNKIRTFFAIIILAIGISTIMVLTSISKGAEIKISEQFGNMGTNLIIVSSGKTVKVIGRQQKINQVTTLTLNDADAILNECSLVGKVVPSIEKAVSVKYGNVSTKTMVQGITIDYPEIKNFTVIQGRFFSEDEDKLMKRVAVIGDYIQKNLFGNSNPIGETFFVGTIPFEVIGVLSSKGLSPEGTNEDNVVLIPVHTAQRRVLNIDFLSRIFVQAKINADMNSAEKELECLLRERHKLNQLNKKNDFTLDNKLNAIKAENESLGSFNWLVTMVTGFILLIGGIGVLSVMLLSVRERISEIGLRISIGAKRSDILKQFLCEAAMLGITGGITGTIFGIMLSIIIGKTTEWQTDFSLQTAMFSIGLSISLGLVFGVYPAFKAAKLDPIQALQKE